MKNITNRIKLWKKDNKPKVNKSWIDSFTKTAHKIIKEKI